MCYRIDGYIVDGLDEVRDWFAGDLDVEENVKNFIRELTEEITIMDCTFDPAEILEDYDPTAFGNLCNDEENSILKDALKEVVSIRIGDSETIIVDGTEYFVECLED